MATNPVVWFEIYVQDMARARAFYEKVLNVKLENLPAPAGEAATMEMYAFPMHPEGGGAGGTLVKMDGVPSGGMGTLVYFTCQDCAVELGRVKAAGGKIFKDKFAIGQYGFCALAHDTEGNMFGLHSMQ